MKLIAKTRITNTSFVGLKNMKEHKTESQFVICIQNKGCEDLELSKVYQVITDEFVAQDSYIRMIDESGEDYLYPANYFVPIALPQMAKDALLAVSVAA
ncbi:MAG: hypothetical protein ABH870_05005 [bacterium]